MLENALKKHTGLSAWILSVHCVARLAAVAMMAIFSPGGNALSLMSRSPTVFHHCWSLDTGLLAVRVPTHRNGIPCQTVLVHLQNVSDRKQHFREP